MRILMAAGGTGGHVFPALAVARAFLCKHANADVRFVGTPRGMEKELIPSAGFDLEFIDIAGLKGKGWTHRLKTFALLPKALLASWKLLRTFNPDAVFGIGGYASGPVLLVAALTGRKTAILEPNAIAGFSNRMLGKVVHRVFIAFREALGFFPSSKVVHSGNPIRQEILSLRPPMFDPKALTVLVFGGSQGARAINQAVMDALGRLTTDHVQFTFIHQTGRQDERVVREAYERRGIHAEVFAFSDRDLVRAYDRAHVVIARGGSSVLEIAACGRPSILVPYPYAADDHQRANAKVMSESGAALYIENQDLSGEWLAETLNALAQDTKRLIAMSESALTLRYDRAAEMIVEGIEEMVA